MPRAFSLTVDGVQQITDNINRLIRALDDPINIGGVFTSVAAVFRDDARRRAPVKTGWLRSNIFSGPRRTKIPSAVVGVRYKKVPYCWDVEFGTSRRPAQPFLRTAATSQAEAGLQIAHDQLAGILERSIVL